MWTGKASVIATIGLVGLVGCGELIGGGESRLVPKLESEAKSLALVAGCEDKSQCVAAPVGVRPCGGPRYYLPYCPLTTDTVALNAKLAEIAAADRAYNKKHNIAGTCDYRMPPDLALEGGKCVAVGVGQPALASP